MHQISACRAFAGAAQSNCFEHVVEQAASFTGEGLTRGTFFVARCISHDQPLGLSRAHAHHTVCPLLAKATGFALCGGGLQTDPIHAGQVQWQRRMCWGC
jgi:hypothetical protein